MVKHVFRIISGEYKGRKLQGPNGSDFRPTTGRVKEFIFSYLGEFILGAEVLDLFSGTGSLGLEALSRGAADVTFVEKSSSSLQILKKNLATCRVSERFRIYQQDVFSFLQDAGSRQQQYDIILADPPFKNAYRESIVQSVAKQSLLKSEGVLLVEHESGDKDSLTHSLSLLRERRFGGCTISVYE